VDARLFWKSLAIQAIAVFALFGILVALPLPDGFFEDYGAITGPLAWIACSAITARVLHLPGGFVAFAALAGGVAGVLVMLAASHIAGMIAALLLFAASCGSYDPEALAAEERRSAAK
jgi:hypothetical protein